MLVWSDGLEKKLQTSECCAAQKNRIPGILFRLGPNLQNSQRHHPFQLHSPCWLCFPLPVPAGMSKEQPRNQKYSLLVTKHFFFTWSVCLSAAGLGKNAITVPSRCRHLDDHVQEIWPWGLPTSTNTLGICMHVSHVFVTALDSTFLFTLPLAHVRI